MRVTVGMPFVDAGNNLANAIRSVVAQKFRDWELLLLDDGSSDNSLEIARAIRHPKVRVISDGAKRGIPARLNQIAQMANGQYLARMNADDLMHPQRLARQVEYLDAHPNVDVLGTAAFLIDDENTITGGRHLSEVNIDPQSVVWRDWVTHPTVMARTQWFRDNPYTESPTKAQDQELWCRTCRRSAFAVLPQPLFYRRQTHMPPRACMSRYVAEARSQRDLFVRYGPSVAGWPRTIGAVLKCQAKTAAYSLCTLLGAHGPITKGQSGNRLDLGQLAVASEGLAVVMRTRIPGLDQ